MFDNLKAIITGLNIFDLREPNRFRFYSIYGFAIYLVAYVVVISYDVIFKDKCIGTLASGWEGIAKNCGLTSGAIVFQFLYMNVAFAVINLVKKEDWSSDAVFNNVSLLIILNATLTGLFYQYEFATWVQSHVPLYFAATCLAVLLFLVSLSLLATRHSRPQKFSIRTAICSADTIRLGILYFILSTGYFVIAFAVGV